MVEHPLTVTDEQAVDREVGEVSGREKAYRGMQSDALAPCTVEFGNRPERLRGVEGLAVVEGGLLPDGIVEQPSDPVGAQRPVEPFDRGIDGGCHPVHPRREVDGDAVPGGDGRGVSFVSVEQDTRSGDLPQLSEEVVQTRVIDRVEDPYSVLGQEGVTRSLEALVRIGYPPDPVFPSVDFTDRRGRSVISGHHVQSVEPPAQKRDGRAYSVRAEHSWVFTAIMVSGEVMTETLSMGIDVLDEHLNGGPRPGTLISLTAPPASQASSLFYALMRERPTIYITTLREESAVRDELEWVLEDNVEFAIKPTGNKRPLRSVNRAIEQAEAECGGERMNIIVDTVNALERTGKHNRYIDLLNAIKSYLLGTDSIALFHCTELGTDPSLRGITLSISDLVMRLDFATEQNTVENRLTVPKFRSWESVDEVIKLKLGQEALVDTSRNL